MVDRIKALCMRDGTNFSAVEKELGFANASIKKMNEKSSADRVYALAKRFRVPMEYIYSGENAEHLGADESELLRLYRALSPEKQVELLDYARYHKEKEKTDSSKVG